MAASHHLQSNKVLTRAGCLRHCHMRVKHPIIPHVNILTVRSTLCREKRLSGAVNCLDNLCWAKEPIDANGTMQACNVVGSAEDIAPGKNVGSWLKVWRTKTDWPQEQAVMCAGCDEPASNGGHVWLRGQEDAMHCYIIPLCSTHNGSTYDHPGVQAGHANIQKHWFSLKPESLNLLRIKSHRCYSLPTDFS
jgi:hypothetical protein